MQEGDSHLPWKLDSLVGEEQEQKDSKPVHQDFDPTKFILVDKEIIQKIDVMKSKQPRSTRLEDW